MIGSFISGLSGLRANQTKLEVIGNNIANANTVGFKSSRVDFSDVLSRTLRGATASTAPLQVGRGATVGAISTQMTQGGFQDSSNAGDLAIQGSGFFTVTNESGQQLYTRAGNFRTNTAGELVTVEGFNVQGFNATEGQVPVTAVLESIQLPREPIPPRATSTLEFRGNLDASSPVIATDPSGRELRVGGQDGIIGTLIDGSVTLVDNGAAVDVTGRSTTFTTLSAGDTLIVDGRAFTVASVADDLTMVLDRPVLTGTIEGLADSSRITGTDTAFTSELRVGDTIEVDGADVVVTAVTSDTEISIATPLAADLAAGAALAFSQTTGVVTTESRAESTVSPAGTTRLADLPSSNLTVSLNGSTNILVEDLVTGEQVVVTMGGTQTVNEMVEAIQNAGIATYSLNDANFQVSQLDDENGSATSFQFVDSQGAQHVGIMSFFRTETPGTWVWNVDIPAANAQVQDPGFQFTQNTRGTLLFNDGGAVDSFRNLAGADVFNLTFDASNSARTISVEMSADTIGAMTQFNIAGDVVVAGNDGTLPGEFQGFTVDPNGMILGQFSNGETRVIAQVLLADFANATGMDKAGSNLFSANASSGTAEFATAGQGGLGRIISGATELSNVDLAEQFTSLIMAQRGFQASANVITTSDTIMNDVLSLKRG
ncbi:flagellar hook-basal body complex protein [Candidatus Poribacteria bacterium]|jgi:flagellar hook protein FlgE|nr:flagellar hook-basal body complex protein [Candidatus Poribacteria bacterium]MBT5531504.1 flagellar hook-basal body complex protein [Candidatus Poribacteria bacterium]MBT7804839.1 flagellar hook-basal body complex protein [Candidatus Poribacteria bacterium]